MGRLNIFSNSLVYAYGEYTYTQDKINNKTNLTTKVILVCYGGGAGYETFSGGVQVGGGFYSGSAININLAVAGTYVLYSRTDTITHNSDGSFPTGWGLQFNCGNAGAYSYSSHIYLDTVIPKIPRGSTLTSVTETIPVETTTNIEVVFSKKVNTYYDKLEIVLNGEVIKTVNNVTSPYAFNFTTDEVTQIQNILTNSNTGDLIFNLSTYSDSALTTQIGTTNSKKVTASIVDANPLFSNFTYEDTDEVTLALTGNNQVIVNGYSDLKVIVNTDNKAVAQKGATMSFYQINNDAYAYAEAFSQVLENYARNTVQVYAIDSRQNSKLITKVLDNFINYKDLIISSSSYERDGNINEPTKFNFGGTYWSGNFGAVANSISATYRYKETGSSKWIEGVTPINIVVLTSSENEYSFEGYLQGDVAGGFSADKSFNVEIIVSDKLSSKTISYIVSSGEPALDVFKSNLAVGGIYNEEMSQYQAQFKKAVNFENTAYIKEKEIALKEDVQKIYSTNEVKTNKVWIDGKPIYRKTFTSTTNERNFNITHGVSIDTVVAIDGYYRMFNTTWFRLGCVYYLGNIEYLTALRVSGSNIEVSLGSWINVNSDMITHVTIEYTKTTD